VGPRADTDRPYAVAGNQPTDPNNDGLYEDVNGDGAVNIIDADALQRNRQSAAVGANWTAYDFTGDNRTDVGDVQWLFNATQSSVINDSDGHGLPNEYELNVTETDPSQADSDADGRIDGLEDFDGDNLTAYHEYRLGTDPRNNDTDSDGLADGFESQRPGLDPTTADTDGDGVFDPQEDLDGDNLSVPTRHPMARSSGSPIRIGTTWRMAQRYTSTARTRPFPTPTMMGWMTGQRFDSVPTHWSPTLMGMGYSTGTKPTRRIHQIAVWACRCR